MACSYIALVSKKEVVEGANGKEGPNLTICFWKWKRQTHEYGNQVLVLVSLEDKFCGILNDAKGLINLDIATLSTL
jgi:hypothetical protein